MTPLFSFPSTLVLITRKQNGKQKLPLSSKNEIFFVESHIYIVKNNYKSLSQNFNK